MFYDGFQLNDDRRRFLMYIYAKMSGVDDTITRFSIGLRTNGHHCSYSELHK